VDHGSVRPAANDMLHHVTDLFKRVSGASIVELAHMELARPSIQEAFDACVEQGATTIVVHPYFLAPGRHSTSDIPRMTRDAAAQHPGIRFYVTEPLGLDERITRLMMQRIEECIQANRDDEAENEAETALVA
jgi:sirohydrochlorin ferrochelatase